MVAESAVDRLRLSVAPYSDKVLYGKGTIERPDGSTDDHDKSEDFCKESGTTYDARFKG